MNLGELMSPYFDFITILMTVVINIYFIFKKSDWWVALIGNALLIFILQLIGLDPLNFYWEIIVYIGEIIGGFLAWLWSVISGFFEKIFNAIGDWFKGIFSIFLKINLGSNEVVYDISTILCNAIFIINIS